MPIAATLPVMPTGDNKRGKKKPTRGEHKTARKPVQFPVEWLKVIQKRAAEKKQPKMWYLLSLVMEDLKGVDIGPLPLPPWEQDQAASDD